VPYNFGPSLAVRARVAPRYVVYALSGGAIVGRPSAGALAQPARAGHPADDRRDDARLRPVPNSNLQLDFNVSVRDSFDKISSAALRELDESNRFVQKSAESTSM